MRHKGTGRNYPLKVAVLSINAFNKYQKHPTPMDPQACPTANQRANSLNGGDKRIYERHPGAEK